MISPRWRYRLGVRTDGSQPSDRGSIPRSATTSYSKLTRATNFCHLIPPESGQAPLAVPIFLDVRIPEPTGKVHHAAPVGIVLKSYVYSIPMLQ